MEKLARRHILEIAEVVALVHVSVGIHLPDFAFLRRGEGQHLPIGELECSWPLDELGLSFLNRSLALGGLVGPLNGLRWFGLGNYFRCCCRRLRRGFSGRLLYMRHVFV